MSGGVSGHPPTPDAKDGKLYAVTRYPVLLYYTEPYGERGTENPIESRR